MSIDLLAEIVRFCISCSPGYNGLPDGFQLLGGGVAAAGAGFAMASGSGGGDGAGSSGDADGAGAGDSENGLGAPGYGPAASVGPLGDGPAPADSDTAPGDDDASPAEPPAEPGEPDVGAGENEPAAPSSASASASAPAPAPAPAAPEAAQPESTADDHDGEPSVEDVTTTHGPDGSSMTVHGDGTVEYDDGAGLNVTSYPNGDQVTTLPPGVHVPASDGGIPDGSAPDGTAPDGSDPANPQDHDGIPTVEQVHVTEAGGSTIREFGNGDINAEAPVGSLTVHPDGSWNLEGRDGSTELGDGQGNSLAFAPDGTVTSSNAHGVNVSERPDGSEQVTDNDGTDVTRSPNGMKSEVLPGGDLVTSTPDHEVIVASPNGRVLAVHPDGSYIIHNPDGTTESGHSGEEPATLPPHHE